jgi:hypothetical protein
LNLAKGLSEVFAVLSFEVADNVFEAGRIAGFRRSIVVGSSNNGQRPRK